MQNFIEFRRVDQNLEAFLEEEVCCFSNLGTTEMFPELLRFASGFLISAPPRISGMSEIFSVPPRFGSVVLISKLP